jgi:uncharacterized repeat protein (TIGR03803 family)
LETFDGEEKKMRKAKLGYSFRWHAGKRLMAAISLSAVLSAGASAPLVLAAVLVGVVAATPSAEAQVGPTFNLLYSFKGGTDGEFPRAGLVRDAAGNVYGTIYYGGDIQCFRLYTLWGCGTVFKVDTTGKKTVLHTFTGSPDGKFPEADLLRDTAGNLYGTTSGGGASGYGVVFKLDPTGKETVLHSFTGSPDGSRPGGDLIRDANGNIYGSTGYGGTGNGTIFKVDADGEETVLYSFTGSPDGQYPVGALVRDGAGDLYGMTYIGGISGVGTVFKVDTTGKETVLHSFTGKGGDGAYPVAGLVRDAAGNLYGTTIGGGASCNCGTVFKLDTTGKETVLHHFTGSNGADPYAGLVRDSVGNLYGTTFYGGASGYGVVFKLDPTGKETVLHSFTGGTTDGTEPRAGLVRDAAGNLYGTTQDGGASNRGTVFKLTP